MAPGTSDGDDPNGELTIGHFQTPAGLDPHREPHIGQRAFWLPLYDTLFDLSTPELQPFLVDSHEISGDGLTWTLRLREDATFQDDSPVNAAAVVASLDRARNWEHSSVAGFLSTVNSIEADDEFTVVIGLTEPTPQLGTNLAGPAGAIINPVAIEDGRDLALAPGADAGSGGYSLVELVPNDRVTFRRADRPHWNSEIGRLAAFTFVGSTEFQTLQNGLVTDEFDLIFQFGQYDQRGSFADDGYVLYDYDGVASEQIYLRNTRGELGNPNVRRAISHVIDRQAISDALFAGECAPTTQLFPDFYPLHVEGDHGYAYDPDAARALVEDHPEAIEFELWTNGSGPSFDIIQIVQQQLDVVGIETTLMEGPSVEGTQKFIAGEIDARETQSPIDIHPLVFLANTFLNGGRYELAGSEGDELAALAESVADPALSDDELAELYQQIGALVTELSLIVPICFSSPYIVASPEVTHLEEMSWMWSGAPDMRFVGVAAE